MGCDDARGAAVRRRPSAAPVRRRQRGDDGPSPHAAGGTPMRLRLIHDPEGRIVSHAPPGTELTGPLDADKRISEVEAPDIDPNELDISRLQSEYRVEA